MLLGWSLEVALKQTKGWGWGRAELGVIRHVHLRALVSNPEVGAAAVIREKGTR